MYYILLLCMYIDEKKKLTLIWMFSDTNASFATPKYGANSVLGVAWHPKVWN